MELRLQFLMPLGNQGRGHEDQHAAGQAAEQVFPQQQAGLDRLAQTHFVGQKDPPAEMPQHLADRFDLVRQVLDAGQALEAEQLIEAAEQAQPGEFQVQPQAVRIVRRGAPRRRQGPQRNRNASRGLPARCAMFRLACLERLELRGWQRHPRLLSSFARDPFPGRHPVRFAIPMAV